MQRIAQLCLGFCLSLSSTISIAEPEAMALLERMGTAAKTLNYDGVFTYQTGNKVQAIRIIHSATEDGEVERLLSLNGAARELIRTNDHVTCIFPEGKQINIDRRPLGRGFPSDLLSRMSSAAPYYAITMGESGRVANRQAKQLLVTPVDQYRYGYHLWVDEETDLLLQSELLTEKALVLEKFTFSSINMNIDIPDLALKPQIEGQEHTWNRNQTEPVSKGKSSVQKQNETVSSLWQVAWLPEGFGLVAEQSRRKSENGMVVEQRVYSDGLSSVSVFIEQRTAAHRHLEGGTKMGAINAFGIVADNHFITTVGQVPANTVKKIGRSMIKVPD
jgi:sigma-E factor negative regulatory protein RseB